MACQTRSGVAGIGMSFLEAMALGRCVVAPDATTMNEYIEHGMNGILYDPSSPQPIQNHDIRKLQENAAESIRKGHEKWLEDLEKMMSRLTQPVETSPSRIAFRMALRMCKNPVKTTKALLDR